MRLEELVLGTDVRLGTRPVDVLLRLRVCGGEREPFNPVQVRRRGVGSKEAPALPLVLDVLELHVALLGLFASPTLLQDAAGQVAAAAYPLTTRLRVSGQPISSVSSPFSADLQWWLLSDSCPIATSPL